MTDKIIQIQSTCSKCPTCGRPFRIWKHRLTPGLVSALIKFRAGVQYYGRNDLHLHNDMKIPGSPFCLTDFEWNNFSKLRFHGLVAKVRKDGKHQVGRWLLTERGAQFLRGEITVPTFAETQNNRVVGHSGPPLHINDFRRKIGDIWFEQNPQWESKPEGEMNGTLQSGLQTPLFGVLAQNQ
jgi:hypothetical protein